jgi:cytochrome c-type biogenesis protein CcmH
MRIIFLLMTIFTASFCFAISPADSERYETLTKEIRCLVCQNQNIADSNAPLATDLKHKVYALVLLHTSDNEIKEYLVKRYGEFILLKPRLNKSTLLLWALPFVMLGGALLILLLRSKK